MLKKSLLVCLTVISMQPYMYAGSKSYDMPEIVHHAESSSRSDGLAIGIGLSVIVAAAVGVGCGVYAAYQVRKQIDKEEFTPAGKQQSDVAYVFANGLGNPRFRCAVAIPKGLTSFLTPKLLLLQYPHYFDGRFFAMHPKHAFADRSEADQLYVDTVAENPEIKKVIRVGHSCGASDAIIDLSIRKQSEKLKGVVAISPFAHTDDIINNWWVARIPGINMIARAAAIWMLRKFDGYQPIDIIKEASEQAKKTPVCIVASTGDWTVPSSSSARLAQAMQDAGFKDVTFIQHINRMSCGHDLVFVGNDKSETDAWLNRVLADQESTETA